MPEVMSVNLDECVQNMLSISVLEREVILVGRVILGRMLRVHRDSKNWLMMWLEWIFSKSML